VTNQCNPLKPLTLSISRLEMLSKLRRENSRVNVWASWGWNIDCVDDDLEPGIDCVDDDLEPGSTEKELDFTGEGVWGGSSATDACSLSFSVAMGVSERCSCSELSGSSIAVWSVGSPPRSSFSCSLMPHILRVRSFDHDTSW